METINSSADVYERPCSELELLHMLSEAEEDVRTGHVAPIEESFRTIRNYWNREPVYAVVDSRREYLNLI